MKNAIVWFEIPSLDFERAVKFYKSIVEGEFIIDESNGMKMAIFPYDRMEGVGGAIIQTPNIKPTEDGITVYLAAGESIEKYIDNVIKNGGKIILPKMDIGREMGFIAQFIDPEGNRVGIHGMK